MDADDCVSKKREYDRRGDFDCGLLPVKAFAGLFRPLDLKTDYPNIVGIMWEAWQSVLGIDWAEPTDVVFCGQHTVMPHIEARFWGLLQKSYDYQVALVDDTICAIMIYRWVCDGTAYIKMLYVAPDYRKCGLGIALVKSVSDIKRVIFQTRTDIPPEQLTALKARATGKPIRLAATDTSEMWFMELERDE